MTEAPSEKNSNDNDLIARIKNHERAVLKEIYISHYPAVEKYILTNSGNTEDARDIYQEAFLAFWKNIQEERFYPEHAGAIGGYLLQIARHKWIDLLRREKRIQVLTGVQEEQHATIMEGNREDEKKLSLLKTQYKDMGAPCKELLYRFYYKKEKLKTIAAHFSWTEATAKNNKYRCLQKLRNAVLKAL